MQSFYDAGFVFGSSRMNFETVGLPKRKRHHEDHELRVQKKDSGGRRTTRKEKAPMLTRRHIAHIICVFCTINDVQRRAIGLDDLLNKEVRYDNLKRVHQAWAQTLMAK